MFDFWGVVTGPLADKSIYADYRTRHRSIVHVYATFLNTSYCNGLSENGKGQVKHLVFKSGYGTKLTVSGEFKLLSSWIKYSVVFMAKYVAKVSSKLICSYAFSLEKEMTTDSSILAWRILWTEEPGGLQSTCHKELDTTEAT